MECVQLMLQAGVVDNLLVNCLVVGEIYFNMFRNKYKRTCVYVCVGMHVCIHSCACVFTRVRVTFCTLSELSVVV